MDKSLCEYIATSRTKEGVLPEGFKLPDAIEWDRIITERINALSRNK
ncbi:MAG: hypothetical protein K6F51_11270 [Acetatifactor sp.]|nr:hypothetical protein [Acetatifactor sp.]